MCGLENKKIPRKVFLLISVSLCLCDATVMILGLLPYHPAASATFVLYLLSDDGQRAFNNIVGGGMPCTKEGIEAGYWRIPFDEDEFNYDAFIAYPDAFKACWPQCYTPPEIADVVEKYLPTLIANHFSNKRDYTDTLSLLEKECNEKWMTIFD